MYNVYAVHTCIGVHIQYVFLKLMDLVINVNRHYFVYELDNDKSLSFLVADDQEVAFGGTDGSEEDL